MPHTWWHQWGQPEPNQDPSIWQEYGMPALGAVVGAPGVRHALQGMEAIHQRGVVPIVSSALEPLPVAWEEYQDVPPEVADAPWYRPDLKFQQGRVVPSFDQYVTPEGDFSPGGAFKQFMNVNPLGITSNVGSELFNLPQWQPDTLRNQRIAEQAQIQEMETGQPVSQRERREIGEDLYKLPPYTRGLAEELPYLAVPPAKAIRTGLQGLRTGPVLANTGRLSQAAPAARASVRATEIALKPIEIMEEAMVRAVSAPFTTASAAIGARKARIEVERGFQGLMDDGNKRIADYSKKSDAEKLANPEEPEVVLDIINSVFETWLPGSQAPYELTRGGRIIRNPDGVIPEKVPFRNAEEVRNIVAPRVRARLEEEARTGFLRGTRRSEPTTFGNLDIQGQGPAEGVDIVTSRGDVPSTASGDPDYYPDYIPEQAAESRQVAGSIIGRGVQDAVPDTGPSPLEIEQARRAGRPVQPEPTTPVAAPTPTAAAVPIQPRQRLIDRLIKNKPESERWLSTPQGQRYLDLLEYKNEQFGAMPMDTPSGDPAAAAEFRKLEREFSNQGKTPDEIRMSDADMADARADDAAEFGEAPTPTAAPAAGTETLINQGRRLSLNEDANPIVAALMKIRDEGKVTSDFVGDDEIARLRELGVVEADIDGKLRVTNLKGFYDEVDKMSTLGPPVVRRFADEPLVDTGTPSPAFEAWRASRPPSQPRPTSAVEAPVVEPGPVTLTNKELIDSVANLINEGVPTQTPMPREVAQGIERLRGVSREKILDGDEFDWEAHYRENRPQSVPEYNQNRVTAEARIAEIEQGIASGLPQMWSSRLRGGNTITTRNALADMMKERYPLAPDTYVKLMFSYWDSSFSLRLLQDNYWRSKHPDIAFRAGSGEDLVMQLSLASGAQSKGTYGYTNFIRRKILPVLEQGVKESHIERWMQIKHWRTLLDMTENPMHPLQRKNLPDIIDPDTKDVIKTKQGDIATLRATLDGWEQQIRKELDEVGEKTGQENMFGVMEGAARESVNQYTLMRSKLRNEGIISEEYHDYLAENFKWYNPIEYMEYQLDNATKDIGKFRDITSKNGKNVTEDGIWELASEPDVLGALPPLGETMLRKFINTENRIARNRVTRQVSRMAEEGQLIKNVSDDFKKVDPKTGETTLTKPTYQKDSGYFVFFENGERQVYGGMDGGAVPKWLWDSVNGRSGLAIEGEDALLHTLASANGFFRSVYTTYNPLFFTRNALLDSFTVFLRANILPTTTMAKMMTGIYKAAVDGEDRLLDMLKSVGAHQDRYYSADVTFSQIQREIKQAGHNGATLVGPKTSPKQLSEILRTTTGPKKFITRAKRAIPATGAVIEQAPRLAVMEKSLKKLIGKKEYNRIMKLPREKFEEEMSLAWRPEFDVNGNRIAQPGQGLPKRRSPLGTEGPLTEADSPIMGLMDSDELKHAGANGLDATLNFGRGGDKIRRWNNYILFLNAAMEGTKLPWRTLGINMHPDIRPVKNPEVGGPQWEWGERNILESRRRGITGKNPDIVGDPRKAAMVMGTALTMYWGIQTGWNKQETFEGVPLYYDIPEYIRYNSMVFMLPADRDEAGDYILDPMTGRPQLNYLVIPHKLREWNIFFQSATLLDEITDQDMLFDKSKFASQVWNSTSPVSDLPVPEALMVWGEQMSGQDFWRDAPIVDEELQNMEASEQFDPNTSETMRLIANQMPDVEVPLFNIPLDSPQRVDHLYNSITGGSGRLVTSMTDYLINAAHDLRNLESRPMEDKVQEYREMDRIGRSEFKASLSPQEYDAFEKELRMPRKEIPFWDAMKYSFYPERGGGLRQAGRVATAEGFRTPEGKLISQEQTDEAGRLLSKVRRSLTEQQMEDDSKLGFWMKGENINTLSPKEWRDAKSEKWAKYEGAELAISNIYHRSIYAQDEETRSAYYDSLYTAAGKMSDIRTGIDMLLDGYYAIEPVTSNPEATDWNDFFRARDEYIENIRQSSSTTGDGLFELFERALVANDTPAEKTYDNVRQMLAPYWNVGATIDDLYPGGNTSQKYPQLAEQWKTYKNLDRGRQQQMYDSTPFIQTLVKRRSELRKQMLLTNPDMDLALVFWYGDFHEGKTHEGIKLHRKYYGSGQGSFTPHIPVYSN